MHPTAAAAYAREAWNAISPAERATRQPPMIRPVESVAMPMMRATAAQARMKSARPKAQASCQRRAQSRMAPMTGFKESPLRVRS